MLTRYDEEVSPSKRVNMKYPLGTVSKPVSGKEARKLARAVKSDGYVVNEAADEQILIEEGVQYRTFPAIKKRSHY